MARIFVTGGAGYIGSHVAKKLVELGNEVIVYDNLSNGHEESIHKEALFIKSDLCDTNKLSYALRKHRIDAVMHFAAFIEAEKSMAEPEKYFENNVINGISLLNAMVKNNIKKIVYSSSAGVYGNPERTPIREEDKISPINFYGETKVIFERILRWYDKIYNLKFTALRYFNAAGSDGELGEDHNPETHLIPLVLKAASNNSEIKIFGTDYQTRDGTCIRDYIHVIDLANAHILALDSLDSESTIYNVGSETGYSVRQIIETARGITKKDIKVIETERRKGDPAILVASSEKIKKELGWEPKNSDIKTIIKDAWDWHKRHPDGYKR